MDPLDANENLASLVGMGEELPTTGSDLHMSDVIAVIETDAERSVNVAANVMAEGGDRRRLSSETARIVILEQPASKALRFRYECEGRSAGSIPGVKSTPENKTFPTIQVVGYKGRAAVIVSCVTKDAPYKPHPHNLVGKEGCQKGVFSQHVSSNNMIVSFSNLGIQCVKKKDIEEALKVREEIRVDPFRTGFAHRSNPTGIDLNAVRLCFQVFLEGPEPNTYTRALTPVVSEPIYDKKAMSDLVICKLSDASASVGGGKEMILLCEKVAKEDIQIRFYEERENQVVWEAYADFQPSQVHKQVAISFRTPRYERLEVDGPVNVFIQLKRPSDGATSEALPFQLRPLDADLLDRKKRKYRDDPSSAMFRHLQEPDKSRPGYVFSPSPDSNIVQSVKTEPADTSPGPFYGNLSPMYQGPAGPGASPQPTPIHSPQLPGGRTPSPGDFYPQPTNPFAMSAFAGYAQQPYVPAQPSSGISIATMRSGFPSGGSCTTAPNFAPPHSQQEMTRPAAHPAYPGMVESVNSVGMGLPLSSPEYAGNPPGGYDPQQHQHQTQPHQQHQSQPHQQHQTQPPTSTQNALGLQTCEGVEPIPPSTGSLLDINSGDLFPLEPWGNLSEQMSSSLTLSEMGPS